MLTSKRNEPVIGQRSGKESGSVTPAGITRREFVQAAATAGLMLGAAPSAWAVETKGEVPYRTLGKTGEKISAIGLGGYHIGVPPEAEGIRIIRTAIDRGINFMDNCWDYHAGDSELRMGKALQG